MKVALLLIGHVRKYELSYNRIKDLILDKYDTDVYIGSWNTNNIGFKNEEIKDESYNDAFIRYLNLYKPKSFFVENHNHFYNHRFSSIDVSNRVVEYGGSGIERIRDQWYMVKKTWELINDVNQYDLVIRARPDLYIKQLNIQPKDDNTLTFTICPWPGLDDKFTYGSVKSMAAYCNLFSYFQRMFDTGLDISHAHMLLDFYIRHMQKINCHVDPVNVVYQLERHVNPDGSSTEGWYGWETM